MRGHEFVVLLAVCNVVFRFTVRLVLNSGIDLVVGGSTGVLNYRDCLKHCTQAGVCSGLELCDAIGRRTRRDKGEGE